MIINDILKMTDTGKLIIFTILFLGFQGLVFPLLSYVFRVIKVLSKIQANIIGYISYVVSFIIIIAISLRYSTINRHLINAFAIPDVSIVKIFLYAIGIGAIYFFNLFMNRFWQKVKLNSSFYTGTSFSVWQLIFVVLITPLCEEILFRGLLFSSLVESYGIILSILLNSILFALFHIRPKVMVGAFIGGIAFSVIAHTSASIIPAIISHASYNLLSLQSFVNLTKSKETLSSQNCND